MEEFLTLISGNATISIWISGVARSTSTRWNMIHYLTFCILATTASTRVLTFVSNTRFVWRTIRVKNAFGTTSFVRISIVFRQTLASSYTILLSAICIRTARIWNTWCGLFIDRRLLNCALSKRITHISRQANAIRCMTNHTTLGILSTRVRAWILALVVNASKIASTFGIRNTFRTTVRCRTNKTW